MPLAVPAAIIVALVALLVLLAFRALTQWLSRNFNFNVGVGSFSFNLFGFINNIVDDAYHDLLSLMDALVQPMESLILAPINAFEQLIDSIWSAVDNLVNRVVTIAEVTVPTAALAAIQEAAGFTGDVLALNYAYASLNFDLLDKELTDAEASLTGLLATAEAYTDSRIHALEQLIGSAGIDASAIQSLVNSAVSAALATGLGPIESDLQTVYNSATSYAGSLFVDAEHDISAALTGAEAAATTAITAGLGAIVTDIDHAISGALSGIYTDVDSAVAGAITAAGDVDIDIVAGLRAIPIGAIGDIAALATLTGATALTLTRYLEECGIPNCRNLSGFGKELQAILALVGGADFLELIIELAQHPSDASQIIDSQFGDILSGTTTAFRSLIGV